MARRSRNGHVGWLLCCRLQNRRLGSQDVRFTTVAGAARQSSGQAGACIEFDDARDTACWRSSSAARAGDAAGGRRQNAAAGRRERMGAGDPHLGLRAGGGRPPGRATPRNARDEDEGSNKGFDAAGVGGSQDACCPCSGLEAQAWRPPTHAAGRRVPCGGGWTARTGGRRLRAAALQYSVLVVVGVWPAVQVAHSLPCVSSVIYSPARRLPGTNPTGTVVCCARRAWMRTGERAGPRRRWLCSCARALHDLRSNRNLVTHAYSAGVKCA